MTVTPVPYYSQWESPELVDRIVNRLMPASEDPRWHESGAPTPEEYEFWSWRACGVACFRMFLAHRGHQPPKTMTLVAELSEAGGYVRHETGVHGLNYQPFVDYVGQCWGLQAKLRRRLPMRDLARQVRAGWFAMVSVHPWIRTPTAQPPTKGGHLVLVTGADDQSVTFNNPSGLPGISQQDTRLPWCVFDRFYARRGVLLRQPLT